MERARTLDAAAMADAQRSLRRMTGPPSVLATSARLRLRRASASGSDGGTQSDEEAAAEAPAAARRRRPRIRDELDAETAPVPARNGARLLGKPTRNMYGICVPPALSAAYRQWYERDSVHLAAQLELFNTYIHAGEGYRDVELARGVARGIPTNCRARCWRLMTNSGEHSYMWPDFFDTLLDVPRDEVGPEARDIIDKDIFRTFCDPVLPRRDVEFARRLERVLLAYAVHNPEIAYTQGMNFIAGGFLHFMTENEAFWMLKYVVEELLPCTHDRTLIGAQADARVLAYYMSRRLKRLHAHFEALEFDVQILTSQWLGALFAYSFPMESAFRIWDFCFYRGPSGLFDIMLCLLRHLEPLLLRCDDLAALNKTLAHESAALFDIGPIVHTAMYQRAPLENGAVEMRRRRERAWLRGIRGGRSFYSLLSPSINTTRSSRCTSDSERSEDDERRRSSTATPRAVALSTPRSYTDEGDDALLAQRARA